MSCVFSYMGIHACRAFDALLSVPQDPMLQTDGVSQRQVTTAVESNDVAFPVFVSFFLS